MMRTASHRLLCRTRHVVGKRSIPITLLPTHFLTDHLLQQQTPSLPITTPGEQQQQRRSAQSDATNKMIPGTADLYDEHLEASRVPLVHWIHYGAVKTFAGPAYTIKCFEDNSRLKEMVQQPGEGRILVVDAGGLASRCAILGDQVAKMARDSGWSGIVLYGRVRDVAVLRTLDKLGLVALGSTPRKSVRRNEGQVDLTVRIGDVTVHPGDKVYVDEDGVLILDAATDNNDAAS